MGDFRSFKTARREQAAPMKPLVDPAGWTADELRDVSRWSYRINAADADELEAAVAAVRRNGVAMVDIRKEDFPLKAFADVLTDVRRELMDGRGIVMMQDFPLDRFDREGTAIAYIGLGAHLGQTMSQNKLGHILGHVKDLGGDYNDANTRGYMTNAEMRFHTDACDYVGLLCLQTPMSGGASRIASSVTVYNTMLQRKPELVEALCGDYYRSRSGEVSPGDLPYFKQPIFSFHEGYSQRDRRRRGHRQGAEACGRAEIHAGAEGGDRGLSADRRRDRARHRLPARRHPVPEQFRDAAHAARISRLAGSRAQAAPAAAVALRCRRPADPESAARGPLRPRRQRQGRAAHCPARGGSGVSETVLYAADGKVGIVTLNRPEKLNALTMEMRLAIEQVLLRADADEATSVIVLRAEGRSFCVGFDVGGGSGPRAAVAA